MPKYHCWPLRRLLHLRVALALGALGRAGRGNQRRIHDGARAQAKALGLQMRADRFENASPNSCR